MPHHKDVTTDVKYLVVLLGNRGSLRGSLIRVGTGLRETNNKEVGVQ